MNPSAFEFSSEAENLAHAREFVRGFLEAEGITGEMRDLLVLGVDEACSNIIRHAYGGTPGQPIFLSCERQGTTLRFRLRDFGGQIAPATFDRHPPEALMPGGLGLRLMERIFDEVVYNPQSQGTQLVLTKRL